MRSKIFSTILSETPDEIKEFVQKKSEKLKTPKHTGVMRILRLLCNKKPHPLRVRNTNKTLYGN